VENRPLGESGLSVSVLGLGCWPLGGGVGWENQDERDSLAAIHAALDQGISFFDTAEGYNEGHSEELLGKALRLKLGPNADYWQGGEQTRVR
jgi:aryl-alcohol dehydrogenase-like predicted oxidoreductase